MKIELLKSKLSQLGFSDLKALVKLLNSYYDSLNVGVTDLESIEGIKLEKKDALKTLNDTINDKINLLLA